MLRFSDEEFSQFMNRPKQPDGKAFTQRDHKRDMTWICCPWCGKKAFPVRNDTEIRCLDWKCKNTKCRKGFEINT